MKNRNVGWLVIGISAFIGIIIAIFNYGLRDILSDSCSHGTTCTMYQSLRVQTWLSISIALVIFMIGLFLVLSKENEKIIIKKIKPSANLEPKEFNKKSLTKLGLDNDEKNMLNLLLQNEGSIMQSEIVEKSGLNKVKVTRVLDSLEGRGIVERKRRGMTNIVILKR